MKVPTLPYHHLIALLRKFPADKDSKVLHTPAIKQTLYSTYLRPTIDSVPHISQILCKSPQKSCVRVLTIRLSHHHQSSLSKMQFYAAKVCLIFTCISHHPDRYLAFSQAQRTELMALLQDDASDLAYTETSEAEEGVRGLHLTAAPELFDILATTHNISPKLVQALAADLLKRLTSTSNQDTATFSESLESNCIELPMAFTSSSRL